MSTRAAFREVQRFRQLWLWLLIVPLALLIIGTFAWGMIAQLAFGNPWGDKPMSDTMLAIVGPLVIAFMLLLVYGFYAMRLTCEVREDGIHIRFLPFLIRRIAFENIESVEARAYNSILEYGGWGIRWMPGRGWAYNVSGGKGVQLTFTNGKRLMIGSQRPEELAAAIREGIRR